MKTIALILAGGRGTRFTENKAKQYYSLAGRPIIVHSIEAFSSHKLITETRVVIHPQDVKAYNEAISIFTTEENIIGNPIIAGKTRQESVRNGLEALAQGTYPDAVLIHDAARPLVSHKLIDRILDELHNSEAVIAALPITDTLKEATPSKNVRKTIDRTGLFRAQTPQGFHFKSILEAHRSCSDVKKMTDDAAVAEQAGIAIKLIDGDEDTMKITVPADLQRAEEILSKKNTGLYRIGLGFDVHRFGQGQHVNLCGIEVPHDQGLVGHSDADVCLHALTDAILGAIAKGDIGEHFPDNQVQWKNESSSTFLRHAKSLVEAAKGKIINVDINIICESPKISDYRTQMRQTLATLMDLSIDQISVKATTTERLGFLGRVEGIAAQAIAMLYLSNSVKVSDE